MNTTTPRLVDEHEAADILGLSARTLREWRRSGTGPRFVKLGRSVRYEPAELDAFIAANRATSTAAAGSYALHSNADR